MCLWIGWVVPCLFLPALTPGLVQLEGQLGWGVQDDFTHTPGSSCWQWAEPLWFSSMWPFTLPEAGLAFLCGGLRVDSKKGKVEATRPPQAEV